MFAFEHGTVYGGKNLALRENKDKPYIQIFKNELIQNQVGVAIEIKGMNNAGVTIIEDCTFYNNFGSLGGSIHVEQGGALVSLNNHFSQDKRYLTVPPEVQRIIDVKQAREEQYLGEID